MIVLASTVLPTAAAAPPASDPLRGNPTQWPRLNPAAPPRPGEAVNDVALQQYLEAEGTRLIETGRTLTNWSDRLDPKVCALRLPKAGGRALAPAVLARRVEAASVVLGTCYLCGRCSKRHFAADSAFFIDATGALVTSLHVLANTRTNGVGLVVLTRDGRVAPVTGVLAVDVLHDLVVLQVQGARFAALPLARREAVSGKPVLVVSHPSGHFYSVSTGVVARRGEQLRPGGRFEFLSVTAEVAKGSSGAPVCDETGTVIGVVNNTQSIYYNVDHDPPQNFQMAVRNCSSVGALRRLVGMR
jgi:S1-C subfamily serine protease